MARNHRIRWMNNNLLDYAGSTVTASSEQVGFEISEGTTQARYRKWKTEGNFTFDATNNKLYVTDGVGAQTIPITVGSYTPDTLTAHLESQLDSITDRTWTVSHVSASGKFRLIPSASSTLDITSTTNAAWDTLGWVGSSDITGTDFTADETRIHTSEWVHADLGVPVNCNFVALIGPAGEVFNLGASASIRVMGSNVDSFTAPPLDNTYNSTDEGFMQFFDVDGSTNDYRYWKIEIIDRDNFDAQDFAVNHLYLGDYQTTTDINLSEGFTRVAVDPSTKSRSHSGVQYNNQRIKFLRFSNMSTQYLTGSERAEIEQMIYDLGQTETLYLSLDPLVQCSEDIYELTRYVRFSADSSISHVFSSRYNISMSFEEVL